MSETEKVFKYKLDFYYQSALIYLLTLFAYGGIRGNFVEAKFEYVFNDPLMYVIMFFVVMSLVVLVLNVIQKRRLIITEAAILFKNRFRERRVSAADIEWVHIGRESRVQTGGRFQVIVFKLKEKRRFLRIRVGRYERDRELVAEVNRFTSGIPKRNYKRWSRPGFTDR